MKSYTLNIILFILAATAVADVPLFTDAAAYNAGELGNTPNQTFRSSNIIAPVFLVNTFDVGAIDGTPYLFMDWSYDGVSSPMIFRTDDLSLVYADQEPKYPSVNDVRVQAIRGEDYLTFWEGIPEQYHGNGHALVVDAEYNLKYDITPVGLTSGRLADEHEFQFTDEGNAIITVYESIPWDLTDVGGPPDGLVLDQLFQEINPENGELIFSWRASDHFDIDDSYATYPEGLVEGGFDYFHMNSVAKVWNP
ncbi:Zinc finger protein GLIS3 [Madurella fahalii]|uniref:Zinc finger protein GLIS3 n=1 Tax=Madurella fahalii TaxID=1157608 RepID=A0ABQ0G3I6_9PEZI